MSVFNTRIHAERAASRGNRRAKLQGQWSRVLPEAIRARQVELLREATSPRGGWVCIEPPEYNKNCQYLFIA